MRIIALASLLMLAACTKPTHITIDPKQPQLKGHKETVQLIAHVMTNSVEDALARVEWKSANPEIAEVDAGGRVSGRSSGRAELVATYGDLKASVPIEVSWVEQVRADKGSVEISYEAGDAAKVKVEAVGYDGRVLKDRAITWKSETESVCRADASGQIWPAGVGEGDVVAMFDEQHSIRIHCVVKK